MLLRQQATLIIGNWKLPVTLARCKLVQNKGRSQNEMRWGKSKEWVNEGRKHRQLFLEVGRWRRGNRLSCSEESLIGWIKIVLKCEWLECLWKKKKANPSNSTPKYSSKRTENWYWNNLCTSVSITKLFLIFKRWKWPNCTSVCEWINKWW